MAARAPASSAAAIAVLALGDGDVDRGEQQLEHGVGVVAEVEVALARVAGGEARGEQGRQPQRERRVGAVEGDHAAVAELGVRADDPGPGADQDRVPAEPVAAASSAPTVLSASCSPP